MIQEAAGIRKILPQTATALDVCCVRGGAVTTTREACHASSQPPLRSSPARRRCRDPHFTEEGMAARRG